MSADFSGLILRPIDQVPAADCGSFCCGRIELDTFLRDDAKQYQECALTNTSVAYMPDDPEPAGFFSLSADAVKLTGGDKGDLGLPFDFSLSYFPAVKITKFAVATRYQRSGLAYHLMEFVEGLIFAHPFAIRVLTVDAVNSEQVLNFYTRVGFVESLDAKRGSAKPESRTTILMFKDLYAP